MRWPPRRAIPTGSSLRHRSTAPGWSTTPRRARHLSLGKVKGELYIACAEHDELAPLPMVEELRGLFRRAGTAGEIELYPGVHHGFAFPQRWCYDKSAAERHWERLIALYRRRLG